MNMRVLNSPGVFFVSIALIMVVCGSGCTSFQSTQSQSISVPQGAGISDVTPRDDAERVSLTDALNALNATQIEGVTATNPIYISYILGKSLDPNGTAKLWAIGARQGTTTFFFMYDARGSQILNWSASLPGTEINLSEITNPEDLFIQHHTMVEKITDSGKLPINELEIRGDLYTLTIQSNGTSQEYLFDKSTGKVRDLP